MCDFSSKYVINTFEQRPIKTIPISAEQKPHIKFLMLKPLINPV